MQRQAEIRAHGYNMRVRPAKFEVGQFVWMYYPRRRQGLTEKWTNYFIGPFKIERQINSVLYQIRKSPRSQARICYVDKLKLYFGTAPEIWNGKAAEVDLSPLGNDEQELETVAEERPKRNAPLPVRYRNLD
jgi:hypothetical protein